MARSVYPSNGGITWAQEYTSPKPNGVKVALPSASAVPLVKAPPPVTWKTLGFTEAEDELTLYVSPSAFIQICAVMMSDQRNEVAGFGYVQDGILVWTYHDKSAVGSPGHVSSNTAEATMACLDAFDEVPNLQFHTHPSLSAYHSGTDKRDIGNTVAEALTEGSQYFLVVDELDWCCVFVEWDKDKKATLYEVECVVLDGDTELPLVKVSKWSSSYKSYTSYGLGAGSSLYPSEGNVSMIEVDGELVEVWDVDDDEWRIDDLIKGAFPDREAKNGKGRGYIPYGHGYGGDEYGDYMSEVEELAYELEENETAEEYLTLFNRFFVEPPNWHALVFAIENEYPNMALDIVLDRDRWEML